MSLPKLPSLDDVKEKKKNSSGSEGSSFQLPKLPTPTNKVVETKQTGLPSLPPLGNHIEVEKKEEVKEEVVQRVKPSGLPSLEDIIYETGIAYEEDDFAEVEDEIVEEVEDDNDFSSMDEGFSTIDDEEIEQVEDLVDTYEEDDDYEDYDEEEEDFDPEEFSLIPTMFSDNGEVEVEGIGEEPVNSAYANEPSREQGKKDKGFKEFDDESVKRFFDNLKAKFIKPKDNNDDQDKSGKINKEKKIRKPKKKKKLGKKTIIPLVIGVVVVGLVAFLFLKWNNSFTVIDDTVLQVKDKEFDLNVELNEFVYQDGVVTFKVTNNSDISADFFMNATFTTKSFIPFKANKIQCSSDIIVVETGQEVSSKFKCEELDDSLEYKIKTEVIQLQ